MPSLCSVARRLRPQCLCRNSACALRSRVALRHWCADACRCALRQMVCWLLRKRASQLAALASAPRCSVLSDAGALSMLPPPLPPPGATSWCHSCLRCSADVPLRSVRWPFCAAARCVYVLCVHVHSPTWSQCCCSQLFRFGCMWSVPAMLGQLAAMHVMLCALVLCFGSVLFLLLVPTPPPCVLTCSLPIRLLLSMGLYLRRCQRAL